MQTSSEHSTVTYILWALCPFPGNKAVTRKSLPLALNPTTFRRMELSPSSGGNKTNTPVHLDLLERVTGDRPYPETLWGFLA